MTYTYSQRSLVVLSLLGVISAIMSILSVILIFQLQSQQTAAKESLPSTSIVSTQVGAVLLPVSTVLSALSLMLNLCSVVVSLIHSYCTTEVCREEQDTERAVWFLLDSRAGRRVAVGLFCLGVSLYLAAMAIYMLMIFEVETGIASACILSSGILILLVIVIHSLVKVSRAARPYGSDLPDTLYQNQSGSSSSSIPLARPCELKVGVDQTRIHRSQSNLQRQFSYPPCVNRTPSQTTQQHHQQQQYSPPAETRSRGSVKDGYSGGGGGGSRMQRTRSTESILQGQNKPWNGVNNEMRSVLARKSGGSKDSTLV